MSTSATAGNAKLNAVRAKTAAHGRLACCGRIFVVLLGCALLLLP
jgi:hypothetical protein